MSLLIQGARLQDHSIQDVYIQGDRIAKIGPNLGHLQARQVIQAQGQAILPSFVNCHTHAAMSLLRGYADDMELHTWLNNYIWPLEACLEEEDVYIGAKLACLEMIKTGTTFFSDMYWYLPSTAQAVQEMGLRAALSSVFIDFNDPETAARRWQECQQLLEYSQSLDPRIILALGPHAVYSVSESSLLQARDLALEQGLLMHMHLCETQKEVQDCQQQHGLTPVEYLHKLGLLNPHLCACHCIWLQERDMDLLAENQVSVVHNPTSNLKLCSGSFPYPELLKRGVHIGLGTDGCSSNNNLDMLEEMKIAALGAKSRSMDPTTMPAQQIYQAATLAGAQIFGLQAGRIAEGWLADCILVDLNHPQLVPDYNLISNLVYSANGDCVRTTICAGQVLMQDREVPQEARILEQARDRAARLVKKAG
ncbi:MAG: amidohydrolase [Desulfohalobiaceae bacterium]